MYYYYVYCLFFSMRISTNKTLKKSVLSKNVKNMWSKYQFKYSSNTSLLIINKIILKKKIS